MQLGQTIKFKKELIKNYNLTNKERQKNIIYGVKEHENIKEGMVVGVRNIGYKGYWDSDCDERWWEIEDTRKVYLVATNLRGFHRVPEEFIVEVKE